MLRRCAASTANWISRSTAGCRGVYRSATCSSLRSIAKVYWIRSLVPIAKKSASAASASAASAAPGTSIIAPNGGSVLGSRPPRRPRRPGPLDHRAQWRQRLGHPPAAPPQPPCDLVDRLAHAADLAGGRNHRQQDAQRPLAGGAQHRRQLRVQQAAIL